MSDLAVATPVSSGVGHEFLSDAIFGGAFSPVFSQESDQAIHFGSQTEYVLRRDGEELRITPPSPEPTWLRGTLEQLQDLLLLEPGWDSYGAQRVKLSAAYSALALLASVASDNIPLPTVVPTSVGGVQLEWHEVGIDLEIEIDGAGRAGVYYADLDTGEEWESQLGVQLDATGRALESLARHAA